MRNPFGQEVCDDTGPVALSLSRHGVEAHGIDLSTPMVAELRGKPGGHSMLGAVERWERRPG